jgi:hypothetical protein
MATSDMTIMSPRTARALCGPARRRVDDTDALGITVAGHAGRSYSVGAGSCIRAAFVRETPSGTPQPFLRPGLRYVVRVRFGDQTLATRTLSAHRISGERSAVPRC